MISAPTSTPLTTPTLTPDPYQLGTPTIPAGVIAVGGYVQITGTGGPFVMTVFDISDRASAGVYEDTPGQACYAQRGTALTGMRRQVHNHHIELVGDSLPLHQHQEQNLHQIGQLDFWLQPYLVVLQH